MDVKDNIRVVSGDLFFKFGVRSVSMDDIASEVGISKKTIYQFYKDKNELVESVLAHIIERNTQHCSSCLMEAENAVHEAVLNLDFVIEIFKSMNASLLYDLKKYHPKAFTLFQKYKNEFLLNMTIKNLERGVQEDLFRAEINIPVIARLKVEAISSMFDPEIRSGLQLPLVDVQKEIIMHFLYGVINSKGLKLLNKYLKHKKVNPHICS